MAVVIPFIGAAIGGAIGGTFLGVSAAAWGYFAGSLLASALFKPPGQEGPRLEDLTIVGTDYGQAIPWVAGSPRLAPQYIWVSDLREIANTQKVGKGGSQKVTTYTYECDVLVILTENVTEGVARDWVNSELIRNGLTTKEGVWTAVTVYTGEEDQLPDPIYEAVVTDAPAYRGHTTVLIQGLQLGGGKQLPNLEHEIGARGATAGDTDFLCQFQQAVPPEDLGTAANGVRPEVGPDILATSPASLTLTSTPSKFDGSSGFGSGVSGSVAMSSQTQPWRWEGWVYCGSTDLTDSVVRIASIGELAYIEFEFGWSSFGTTFRLLGVSSTIGAQTITVPSTSFPRPDPNQWYHWAWQFNGSNRCAFFFDGGYVGTITCGPTVFGPTAGHVIHFDRTRDNLFYFDSTILRSSLPSEAVWVEGDYTVPLEPFSLYSQEVVPWIDSTPDPESLRNSILALLLRAGYSENEFDVSADLIGTVLVGYAAASVTSTRAHLETLRPLGMYEASCSDKLYIFPRAETPAGTIPWEDLGVNETPGEVVDPFPLMIGNEVEVPAQIAVRYRNALADWNTGTEFSDRGEASSLVTTQTVDMPFGLTPAQAKKIADTIIKDAIAGLGRATLRMGGRKHAKYVEGDVLTTTAPDGTGYRFRIITKRDYIFMLEWEVALDDASALTSPAITFEGYAPTTDPLRVAPTDWEILAIPALQDSDTEAPGPYVAITPARNADSDEWPGAVFVRARLPEAFEQVFISGDVAVMGACQTTLGDFVGGSTVLDWTQKLRVRVRGELASSTYYDFFADRTINAAVVGDEPIRFMRADFVSTDEQFSIYDLSGLMRGQLGQEHLIDDHVAAERFVLLTPALRRMVNQTTDIGQEHQVKAVTLNTLLSNVTDEDFTDDGIALRPYSPVALQALAQTSGDLDVEWVRRSRRVARYTDQGVFAPLGEATEAYRVKIYDDPDADPVRIEDVTTPEYTYDAADIASDGFSSGDPITITVQQLSETVGEGFAVTLEVEAP